MPNRSPRQSIWSSLKKKLSTIRSRTKSKTVFIGLFYCAIQGALVSGLCSVGTIISESFIGQTLFPGVTYAMGQVGTTLAGYLPSFLQFVPNMMAWSTGWSSLLFPVGYVSFELWKKYQAGTLPKNAKQILMTSLAIAAPIAGYAFGWLSLSSAFICGFVLSSYENLVLPVFWNKKSIWSSITQYARVLWAAYGATIINYLKAVLSMRVLKTVGVGFIHCIVQGALVAGICGVGTMISQSFVGKLILPGSLKAMWQMGAMTMTVLGEALPGFLQFIPNLVSWCWGWPLLVIPAVFLGRELFNMFKEGKLPENTNTMAYTFIAIVAPVAMGVFGGLALSSVFTYGFFLGSFWNFIIPVVTSVQTQHQDNENNKEDAPNASRTARPKAPQPVPQPAPAAVPAPAAPPPASRGAGAPITPALNRAAGQAAQQNVVQNNPQHHAQSVSRSPLRNRNKRGNNS